MDKKFITFLTAISIMASSSAVLAANTSKGDTNENVTATETEKTPNYVKYELTVTDIKDDTVTTKTDGDETIIIKAADSVVFDADGVKTDLTQIKKDTVIEVYIDALAPAPLILPAEYTASVIAVKGDLMTDVDVYNKSENGYTNEAGTLEVLVSAKTKDIKFVDVDGQPVEDIDGKRAIVYYTTSTKSIPAQTTAEKIIVLPDNASETSTDISNPLEDISNPLEYAKAQYTKEIITVTTAADTIEGLDADGKKVIFENSKDAKYFDADGNAIDKKIKKDDKIVVFSNNNNDKLTADYIVEFSENGSVDVDTYVKSDTFGEVVNKAFMLALNISDDTEIVDLDNKKLEKADITDKDLMVFYSIVALSIPGQTTPSKIIVLGDATAPVAPEATAQPEAKQVFTDIAPDSKYYSATSELAAKNIFGGYEDNSFKPENKLTRAELAKIICVAKYNDLAMDENKEDTFDDVTKSHWAKPYIEKLAAINVINGKGNGRFAPEENVSYSEAIKMTVGLIASAEDADKKGGYPKGYKKIAEEKNILEGVSEYKNNDSITRGDIAVMIYNALK